MRCFCPSLLAFVSWFAWLLLGANGCKSLDCSVSSALFPAGSTSCETRPSRRSSYLAFSSALCCVCLLLPVPLRFAFALSSIYVFCFLCRQPMLWKVYWGIAAVLAMDLGSCAGFACIVCFDFGSFPLLWMSFLKLCIHFWQRYCFPVSLKDKLNLCKYALNS